MLIIIPCKNEQETIIKISLFCNKITDTIVIDDFSEDQSNELLKKYNINFIRNTKTLGYEKSILEGVKYALKKKYKSICIIDGDGEISPNEIYKIIKLSDGFDIIHGNRIMKKRIFEKIISFIYLKLYKIKDPYCGLKFYKIKKNQKLLDLNIDTFSLKILHSFLSKNSKIYNLDINIDNFRDGSRLGNSFLINFKLFCSFLSLHFWKYFH